MDSERTSDETIDESDGAPRGRARRVGLALGSGSARGWAHIGVIRALASHGCAPDIVCGASIGAVVGAYYAAGKLDKFEHWARELNRLSILRMADLRVGSGGLLAGDRLKNMLRKDFGRTRIEDLPKPFIAVATDMATGNEIWLQEGDLVDALRASMAMPGILVPEKIGGRLLLDGGLVNPVPVSACRQLGAEVVVAVNLNGDRLGRQRRRQRGGAGGAKASARGETADRAVEEEMDALFEVRAEEEAASALDASEMGQAGRRLLKSMGGRLASAALNTRLARQLGRGDVPRTLFGGEGVGLLDVMMTALNIMQDRITRSRMAGDPPDVVLAPRVGHIRWVEFDRAAELIDEGVACVGRSKTAIDEALRRMD